MTYRVKGTLKLPDGSPAANCEIEFVSRKNLSPTVQGSKTNIKTSGAGYYDVTLELGEYAVIIYAGGTYPSQAGIIVVLADTTPGQDLPTLLSNGELLPTTPDYMQQIQAWLVAANEAADDSAASAVASEASAQAAAASAATTAAAVTAHEAKPSAHPISGVDGLQVALNEKEQAGAAASAVASHRAETSAHEIDNITGLRDALIASGGGGGVGGGFGGQYKKLSITVSGTGYQGTITAERLVVESAYFVSKTIRDVSVSFNGANVGENGIDSGSIAPGNWYYLYVIHNSTADSTASLISLSATQPALPAGFTYFALVGCARVQSGSQSFVASVQKDRLVRYGTASSAGSIQIVSSGILTAITSISTSVAVPPGAKSVKLVVSGDTGGTTTIYDSAGIHAINKFGYQNYPYTLDIESIDNSSIKYQVSSGSSPTNIYIVGYYL